MGGLCGAQQQRKELQKAEENALDLQRTIGEVSAGELSSQPMTITNTIRTQFQNIGWQYALNCYESINCAMQTHQSLNWVPFLSQIIVKFTLELIDDCLTTFVVNYYCYIAFVY